MASSEFNLISAPFPSGITWLVSVLTELDVRTTHDVPKRYPQGFWQPIDGKPGYDRVVPEGVAHMRYYLPVLHERNEFAFQPNLEVFWEHFLSFARRIDRPVLLFVRDPRDAIFSLYQRNYQNITWSEYLDRPDIWPDHFPEMFRLPPTETWAVWHAMWMGLSDLTPIKVLQFEESKRQPVKMVEDILTFMGVTRSSAQILQAVERSSFERMKQAMERTEAETGQPFRIARRGQVGEWRETFTPEALRRFGGPAAEWAARMGYEPAAESGQEPSGSFSLAFDRVTPQLRLQSQVASESCGRGDLVAARQVLRQGLQEADEASEAHLLLAANWVAVDWTARVLGDAGSPARLVAAVHRAFHRFNCRFAHWPAVQSMLLEAAAGLRRNGSDLFARLDTPRILKSEPTTTAPAASAGKPLLVESDFKGYDVYGWGGRFYAVSRAIPGMELGQLSRAEIQAHRQRGALFHGDLSFEVKAAVEEHLSRPSKRP